MSRIDSLAAFAVALALAAPAAALPQAADTPATGFAAVEAASRAALATDLMEKARDNTFEVRRSAARLKSLTLSKLTSTESHRWQLADIRENVNDLGVLLASLEQIRPDTTSLQQKTIAEARPRIEALAKATTRAIELKAENSANRLFPEYRDTVASIYENAAELDRMLDTVLDYKDARARLAELDSGTGKAAAR